MIVKISCQLIKTCGINIKHKYTFLHFPVTAAGEEHQCGRNIEIKYEFGQSLQNRGII